MNTYSQALFNANINTRAASLFNDGYTIARKDEDTLIITSNEGTKYEVNTLWETCSCPCFKHHGNCKHWLGWKGLELTQQEYDEHLASQYEEEDEYGMAVYEESLLRRTCGTSI